MKVTKPLMIVSVWAGVGLFMPGCAEPPHVVTDKDRVTSLWFDVQDFEAVAEQMSNSMLNSRVIPPVGNPPLPIAMGGFVDATGLGIDPSVLLKRVRVSLLQSGRVVFVGESDSVRRAMDDASDFFRDDGRATGVAPVYTLALRISRMPVVVNRVGQNTLIFHMSLNAAGDVAVWEDEKMISKQTKGGL